MAGFARHLKNGAESSYGHAGPEFVARIAQDIPAAVIEVGRLINQFVGLYRPHGKIDGQVERVIRKFALVAAAGEMAIAYGIVPWVKGTALTSVGRCFEGWLDDRGTTGSLEDAEAIAHVRAYIQQNPSQFFKANTAGDQFDDDLDIPIHNRVGFVRNGEKGREYCFFVERWKSEVCKGRNHRMVARILLAQKMLLAEPNRLNKVVKLNNKPYRVFVVKGQILQEADETLPEQVPLFKMHAESNEKLDLAAMPRKMS